MSGSLREIKSCEVCGNSTLQSVLNLGLHPMCDDLVAFGDNRQCKLYPIEILFCDECITAHQRFQIPKHELFPTTYHYRSRHTADVLNGMKQLVEACVEQVGTVSGKKVLDIGCNDGSLLSAFRERGTVETFGIEPTSAADDARERGHEVCQAFLNEDVARDWVARHGQPDIITFTNVFAHIEDLPSVIRSLLVLAHAETTIVIENHYLGAVIERRQFDTFYHEHPRTYSLSSFARIAASLGRVVAVAEFPQRYGGNIRVMLQSPGTGGFSSATIDAIVARERSFGHDLAALGRAVEVWKAHKSVALGAAVARHGRLAAKAFPGRSAIPVKLLALDETMISAVFEKPGSGKIGHFVPGTRIPIRSDDEFDSASEGPVVNLAWHIADEIRSYMVGRGYRGELIDIITADDFATS